MKTREAGEEKEGGYLEIERGREENKQQTVSWLCKVHVEETA